MLSMGQLSHIDISMKNGYNMSNKKTCLFQKGSGSMKLTNVELRIPEQMKQYIQVKDTDKELLRNALLLYPSIKDYTISHGKAAEILGINKFDLIALYSSIGLPYFDLTEDEIEEELETYHRLKEVIG